MAEDIDIRQYEEKHLDATLAMIRDAILSASHLAGRTEDGYQQVKSYMVANRGELDPSEQFQNELLLQQADRQSAQAHISKVRLEKLLASPYFARVDFRPDAGEDTIAAYIGRFAFTYGNESIISDWRSPIAALFYDYDIGPATYTAPSGAVDGMLVGKRQIEIEDGHVLYAVDTSSSVRDEVLQRELGKSSDEKMRTIVSSIQREQNAIIRDDSSTTLIIQGVAGSGKTSIALHRVAYLLYRHKDTLDSSSVAILSPNKVFGDYISKVLPELGEEPLTELYIREMCKEILGDGIRIASQRSMVDDTDEAWRKRVRFKGTFGFLKDVLAYLDTVAQSLFEARDLTIGRKTFAAAWIQERFFAYGALPINERIDSVASDIYLELSSNLIASGVAALPGRYEIKTKLFRMLKAKDELALYKLFFKEAGRSKFFVFQGKRLVEWEDACALVLFKSVFDRLDTYSHIKHLVIDEMQDLTPIQHVMMSRLFPCEKTILGDYHQMVEPGNEMSLDRMQTVYGGARVLELMRSYRSTAEIMGLAARVKRIDGFEPIARHGEQPSIIACGNTEGVVREVGALIEEFALGGHRSLCILHKSEEVAHRYWELFSHNSDVNFISSESDSLGSGVSVSSIKMAKGLEFDEVIVLDVDDTHYATDSDKNLLYVAITRAMHKLSLLYRTKPSAFLAG